MGLVCPLVVLLLQCRSILCLHPVNVLSLLCFCRESLLLLLFLLIGHILVWFVPSSFCEWNQRPWLSRQIVMSPVGFLPVRLQGFYGWSIFVRSWIYFFGSHFGFSLECCRFRVLCSFIVGHWKFWLLWM